MRTAEVVPRPPFWLRLSVIAGNSLQLAGLLGGGFLLALASKTEMAAFWRIMLLLVGWSLLYICCHSFAHWLVGRLVGIRFRGQMVWMQPNIIYALFAAG
ncbi:MAG TPA: hypothetical protein VHO69_00370, partial [Phototrophicaceae bacterium]|nr:hypothetical protein [Phototrophicaceae bacterium]